MKNWKTLILLFAVITIAATFAYAGDKMIINFKNGKQQSIDVGEIQSIKFQASATQTSSGEIVSGRSYGLVAKHSGRCMDVAGVGMGNGDNVQQWDCHGGKNQQWIFTDKGEGYYSLKAAHSGKCLDVWGVSKDSGANIYQWDCHGGDNQLWMFIPQGGGYYMITAKHSGKCVDVQGVGMGNGANIFQWDCHGGDNQLWKVK